MVPSATYERTGGAGYVRRSPAISLSHDDIMDHRYHVDHQTIVFTNSRFHRDKHQSCEGHEEAETKPIEDRDRLSAVGRANHTVEGIGDTHDCC
jgi:hypothetical protein